MRRASRPAALGLGIAAALAVVGLWAAAPSPEDEATIRPEPPRDDRPGQEECPSALGPEMVRLPEGFCIDRTEVTRDQYAAWLETSPATTGQPAACADNDDFTPSCAWPPGANGSQPVVCVDWCDASAFCAAAGRRLCGRVGDGSGIAFEEYDDPALSEWHAACTSGGAHEYAYGDTQDTQVCRGADAEDFMTWGYVDVGTLDGCRSPDDPYSQVSDLSGHAAEWEASCAGDGPDDACRIRGGSFQHHGVGLRCAAGRELEWPRSRQHVAVGFRCCAD